MFTWICILHKYIRNLLKCNRQCPIKPMPSYSPRDSGTESKPLNYMLHHCHYLDTTMPGLCLEKCMQQVHHCASATEPAVNSASYWVQPFLLTLKINHLLCF